jgi:hypothetical protein
MTIRGINFHYCRNAVRAGAPEVTVKPVFAAEGREQREARLIVERLRVLKERDLRRAQREVQRKAEQEEKRMEHHERRRAPKLRPWFQPETK